MSTAVALQPGTAAGAPAGGIRWFTDPEALAERLGIAPSSPWLDGSPERPNTPGATEAWSLFAVRGGRCLLRATRAMAASPRVVACVWDEAEVCTDDPALLLGSEAFGPAEALPEQAVGSAAGPLWLLQDPEERRIVERCVAQLLRAHTESRVTVVVSAALASAPLARVLARVALARACLPATLERLCHVRVPAARAVEYVRELGATLIVTTADEQEDQAALQRAYPTTLVLDGDGRDPRGAEPQGVAADYARALVGRVARMPAGLVPFRHRFDRFLEPERLPSRALVDDLVTVYNVAFALGLPEPERERALRDLFGRYLVRIAREDRLSLLWSELLPPRPAPDWTRVPAEILESLANDQTLRGLGRRVELAELAAAELAARAAETSGDASADAPSRDAMAILVAACVASMRAGRSEDDCWMRLARAVALWRADRSAVPAPAAAHPVAALAAAVREPPVGRLPSGWDVFAAGARQYPDLVREVRIDAASLRLALPALELLEALAPDVDLLALGRRMVEAAASTPQVSRPHWWRSLFGLLAERANAGMLTSADALVLALVNAWAASHDEAGSRAAVEAARHWFAAGGSAMERLATG